MNRYSVMKRVYQTPGGNTTDMERMKTPCPAVNAFKTIVSRIQFPSIMAFNDESKKKFIYYVSFIPAFIAIVGWGGYGEYLNETTPRAPNEAIGRIYPLHFHGTDGYLTQTEYFIFWALPAVCLTFFITFAIIKLTIKRNQDWKNPDKD